MAITSTASADGKVLTITLDERFDFAVHSALRAAYAGEMPKFDTYIVDLRHTVYMDSSALGMLLQLKEHAGGSQGAVRIRNASSGIRDILGVANFHQLMTIE